MIIRLTNQRFYQGLMVVTLLTYLFYLIYRALYTINPDSMAFSLLLYYAEVHGFFSLFLFFFQLWNPIKRIPKKPRDGLSVDIFVTTYNENMDIVRKTLVAAKKIRYPHKTYVLDDGCRPECKELAEELGCHYLERHEREGYKAGNLNNGLNHSQGDFIVVFDADHIPFKDFLHRTLGYFEDKELAVVQVPQNFYNEDCFQGRKEVDQDVYWNEQDIFFQLVLPGMDYWDSAYFIGTGAVFRREALDRVGGFDTTSLTEDLNTSLQLIHNKWKIIYHHEALCIGLAPEDLSNYHSQKLRWCEGNIKDLLETNFLFDSNFKWYQKFSFTAIFFSWLAGFSKVVFFVTPAIILLTDASPIRNFNWDFLKIYATTLGMMLFTITLVSRGYVRVFNDEQFNFLNFFVLIRGFFRAIWSKLSIFVVTGKDRGKDSTVAFVMPQILIAILCFVGGIWGIFKLSHGLTNEYLLTPVAIFWSFYNGTLAYLVLNKVGKDHHRRKLNRVPSFLPGKIVYQTEGQDKVLEGFVSDFHEEGFRIVSKESLPKDCTQARGMINLEGKLFEADIKIRNSVEDIDDKREPYHYGVKWVGLLSQEKNTILEYAFEKLLPDRFSSYYERSTWFERGINTVENVFEVTRRAEIIGIHLPDLTKVLPLANRRVVFEKRMSKASKVAVGILHPGVSSARSSSILSGKVKKIQGKKMTQLKDKDLQKKPKESENDKQK